MARLEQTMGPSVDAAFSRCAPHVVTDGTTGSRSLTLWQETSYNRWEETTVTEKRPQAGQGREVLMGYKRKIIPELPQGSYDTYVRYSEGPDKTGPKVEVGSVDGSGVFKPWSDTSKEPEGGTYTKFQNDRDTTLHAARYWPYNLSEGCPVPPSRTRRLGFAVIGRLAGVLPISMYNKKTGNPKNPRPF